jgi:hypothetical protein
VALFAFPGGGRVPEIKNPCGFISCKPHKASTGK